MKIEEIKFDCKYFQGHIPCKPNKLDDSTCDTCTHYTKISKKILIIKLAAIGDVIRTTPLIEKYKTLYPDSQITWVTLFPDVLPTQNIDRLYKLDAASMLIVKNTDFDIAINLDKDLEACMLLADVKSKEKFGFTFKDGHLAAATPKAEHKIITGLFDGISQKNTKSYLEEIFEICHLEFNYEEYLIRINEGYQKDWSNKLRYKADGKKIIGLNTGCGDRWKTRLWPQEKWIELVKKLQAEGYFCVLLGGANEDSQNKVYAEATGGYYPGHFSLEEFIALTDACDLIVTQVSLMMHIAIALKKELILFNNIFNSHEFELYNRGVLMKPDLGCDCYYGNTCSREISCMYSLEVNDVVGNINKLSIS